MLFHLEVNRAGHHIARGQLGAGVMMRHETGASGRCGQQQAPAFAAHGFGDQKRLGVGVVQAGGVELNEFHVGSAATRTPGGCHAVAGGGVGVGGVQVNLACAAGGQNRVAGAEGHDAVGGFVQGIQAEAAPRAVVAVCLVLDQIHQRVVLKQGDVGRLPHVVDQCALHGGAGGVCHVHDSARAVAAFPRQVKLAAFLRKRHAQALQPGDGFGCVFHHQAGGGFVAQTCTGHQRVVHMRLKRVAFFQHGGNAALGPAAGAVGHGALGQNGHAVGGCQVQGSGQAGQAAADDQNVKSMLLHGGSVADGV